MPPVTRFAPSPTGLLHVGNAYSALCCQQWAEQHDAQLLLRIEDIDFTRCRDEFASALIEDLQWLGFTWSGAVRRQSEHAADYNSAIERLRNMGVIYPCFCTRNSIRQELERIGIAPHADDPASEYPGICRHLGDHEREHRMTNEAFAWRLDIGKAMTTLSGPLCWSEENGRHHAVQLSHDMVIGRKDIGFSYHLAVVVDDAIQGVTHVVRGLDLVESTAIQRLLQALLDLPPLRYSHHQLLVGPDGERLAKRNGSTTLKSLREMGVDAAKLRTFLMQQGQPRWPFAAGADAEIRHTLGITS